MTTEIYPVKEKDFGYKYYYDLTPSDGFGEGGVYNLSSDGASIGGQLEGFSTSIEIDRLRFRERGDDLIFSWQTIDSAGNPVDLNDLRFIFSDQETPSVLGISGSLFDADNGMFLSGITQGETTSSATINELGEKQ